MTSLVKVESLIGEKVEFWRNPDLRSRDLLRLNSENRAFYVAPVTQFLDPEVNQVVSGQVAEPSSVNGTGHEDRRVASEAETSQPIADIFARPPADVFRVRRRNFAT